MFKFIPNSFPAFILYSLFAVLLLILVSSSVYANHSFPSASETLSDSLDEKNFIPIGQTTFTVLFWDIYTSQLYTTSGEYPLRGGNDNLLFDINYLTGIESEDLIKNDLQNLEKNWQDLLKKSDQKKGVALVYEDLETASSVIRDLFTPDINKIIIDSKKLFKKIRK